MPSATRPRRSSRAAQVLTLLCHSLARQITCSWVIMWIGGNEAWKQSACSSHTRLEIMSLQQLAVNPSEVSQNKLDDSAARSNFRRTSFCCVATMSHPRFAGQTARVKLTIASHMCACRIYGFYDEVKSRFNTKIWKGFCSLACGP